MPQKIDQVRVLLFNSEDIGMGFNSDTGLAVGTALDFDAPTREPGQEGEASADIVTTQDSLMESLNISADVQGHYAFSSASLKVNFSRNTSFNSVSSFVVAKMVVNNQITRGSNFRIKPALQTMLDTDRLDDFATAFGDSFVRGQFTGGEFYAVMRITCVETSVQTSLAVSLQADINAGLAGGSFNGDFSKASTEQNGRCEFSVSFYQKGGEGAEEIGTTLSVDEVKARLHDLPSAVSSHPFPYQIEVATYDTVPLPMPPKEQRDDFLLALADADQQKLQFLQLRNDFDFAAQHPDFFNDPPPANVLLAASEVYLQAANAAIAYAVKLASGEITPPQLFDAGKLSPPIVFPTVTLTKADVGLEKNFLQFYLFRNDPATLIDDRNLVNAIANIVIAKINDFANIRDPGGDPAKTETLQGQALASLINGITEVTLSGFGPDDPKMGITSVAHLPSMLSQGLTSLDMSQNRISSLQGLEQFPKLATLKLSINSLSDISLISSLTSLKVLDLSINAIADLTPLKALVSLRDLDLSGNKFTDLTPIAGLVGLTRLSLEGSSFSNGGPESNDGHNDIQIATGLGNIPGLANPFFIADKLSVRLGVLKDGPAAQFTGTATRIGQSHRFSVQLTRGAETQADEWRLVAVNPGLSIFDTVPLGFRAVTLRTQKGILFTFVAPDDATKTAMDQVIPLLDPIFSSGSTMDVAVLP